MSAARIERHRVAGPRGGWHTEWLVRRLDGSVVAWCRTKREAQAILAEVTA